MSGFPGHDAEPALARLEAKPSHPGALVGSDKSTARRVRWAHRHNASSSGGHNDEPSAPPTPSGSTPRRCSGRRLRERADESARRCAHKRADCLIACAIRIQTGARGSH
jgi:hypothetical protein